MAISLGLTACSARQRQLEYPQGLWLYGGATRAVSTPMPELRWPPAAPTGMSELPFPKDGTNLGFVLEFIRSKLTEAGLNSDSKVLAIGDDGFAVLTNMESIDDTGAPRLAGRFNFDQTGRIPPQLSLDYYLDLLFNRNPGRYRMFILLVTPRVVAADPGAPNSWSRAESIYSQGACHLPRALAERPLTPDTHLSVLVYEFHRSTSEAARPTVVSKSAIGTERHLAEAGFRW